MFFFFFLGGGCVGLGFRVLRVRVWGCFCFRGFRVLGASWSLKMRAYACSTQVAIQVWGF